MARRTESVLNQGMTNNEKILVMGGNGKTGSRVAQRLTARGIDVRIGSRSGDPGFDWEDRSTWAPVLDGVTSAYVTYYPDLAFPGASERIADFAQLAIDNGVRRLVLLSGRGEEGARRSEKALMASGADWTIVRCAFFAQNFDEGFLAEAVAAGVFALPAGEVTEAIVDVDDIADVVVESLTGGARHVGQEYELSGPRLITFHEAAAELSKTIGRDVRYVPITPAQFSELLAAEGMPDDYVSGLTGVFTEVMDGRNEYLADGVQRALGRAPRDFTDYLRDTAATGVWA
jgi:uncharacterized protein YbjT (DUF2867 family)